MALIYAHVGAMQAQKEGCSCILIYAAGFTGIALSHEQTKLGGLGVLFCADSRADSLSFIAFSYSCSGSKCKLQYCIVFGSARQEESPTTPT
jgi:hypothetical protein